VVAFVGCPSRRGTVFPHIAPVSDNFNIVPPTIAPPPGHFQRLLPANETVPPSGQDSKSGKQTP
jgi:hypothetical protein